MNIWKLTAEGHGGCTVEQVAKDLARIMEENAITEGIVIHNDRKYKVEVQKPYKITEIEVPF